jgi:hypothetical protein
MRFLWEGVYCTRGVWCMYISMKIYLLTNSHTCRSNDIVVKSCFSSVNADAASQNRNIQIICDDGYQTSPDYTSTDVNLAFRWGPRYSGKKQSRHSSFSGLQIVFESISWIVGGSHNHSWLTWMDPSQHQTSGRRAQNIDRALPTPSWRECNQSFES